MDQNVKSPRVDAAVAPGSGVDLWLEEGEIEALHVALAAGVAQRLEISRPPIDPLILVYQLLDEILASSAAASAAAAAAAAPRRQCHIFGRTRSFVLLSPRLSRARARNHAKPQNFPPLRARVAAA